MAPAITVQTMIVVFILWRFPTEGIDATQAAARISIHESYTEIAALSSRRRRLPTACATP